MVWCYKRISCLTDPFERTLNNLKDYLVVMSEMAGVYVLDESLAQHELTLEDLEPSLDATVIDADELAEMAERCTIITSF